MVFKIDRERKAAFARMKGRGTRDERPLFTPVLTSEERKFISKEISRQRREGKPQKQSIAIAFSKARKMFGNARLKRMPNNPRDDTKETRKIRNLLVTLFGAAIALEIIRRARAS